MVRKIFVGIGIVLLISVILPSIALSAPTKASPEYLEVVPIFHGADRYADPYYKETVVAYRMNEMVRIDVLVYNRYLTNANIVEVGIRFDWMPEGRYIPSTDVSRLEPYLLLQEELTLFSIEVQFPDEPGLNEFSHLYDIRVVALWKPGERVVGRWIDLGLAIYSPEQMQAVELYEQLSQRIGLEPMGVLRSPVPPPSFTTSEASVLVRQATALGMDGLRDYEKGEFSEAASTFTTALELYERALTTEAEVGKALEEATIKQAAAQVEQAKAQAAQAAALTTQAEAFSQQAKALGEQATAMDKQATALTTLAYGLSVGTILIGVGVIIYAVRSSRRIPAR